MRVVVDDELVALEEGDGLGGRDAGGDGRGVLQLSGGVEQRWVVLARVLQEAESDLQAMVDYKRLSRGNSSLFLIPKILTALQS